MFSIIVPTFNNLEYLKLCLKSLKKNSKYNHEIIIHINEGTDGTLEFLKNENFITTYSRENAGVCVAFNEAAKKAKNQFIVLAHDDMYFCPGWDDFFYEEIKKMPMNQDFFLSGTMVQPFESYINLDCGNSISNLMKENYWKNYLKLNLMIFKEHIGNHLLFL
jgi:glycosyltransferase involved in cell wall biosynthesis